MKKLLLSSLFMLGLSLASSAKAQPAQFTYFSYEGRDSRFAHDIDHSRQYFNPILSGYYPDPSVLRVGDTYYLVNSTFSYFPGVPIYKSHDLVNWQQIGHVLDRESQVCLKDQPLNMGIYAPQISYNPKNKTYYMTTANMGIGYVFYVKTHDPAKGWSEPIRMKHGGMDTSFFFDSDGHGWVVYNADPFEPAAYEGQKAIHMNEFDWQADTICDTTYELTRGSRCTERPIWIEGPHLYKVGDYYYLMCAENGTGYNHSEVIFRSKSLTGEWEDYEGNPILTQRDLGHRTDPVTCAGHADLVETPDHQWWAVFLGCRPYEGNFFNTGRETFMLPVTWNDGWPTILPHGQVVPGVVGKSGLKPANDNYVTGNYSFTDRFDTPKLDLRWIFLRNPKMQNYDWSGEGISLTPTAVNLTALDSPSALFYRQKHTSFTAETEVAFTPSREQDLAGLAVFQNDEHHYVLGKTLQGGRPAITLTRVEGGHKSLVGCAFIESDKASSPIRLKVEGNGRYYSFSYAMSDDSWHTLAEGADGLLLSTDVAGGFVGTTIGLYATSQK